MVMNNEPSNLEQRLRRFEDIEEIKKLKARYCEACDGGWSGRSSHNVEGIVSLFVEDCIWDGGVFGKREGREALREYYHQNSASNPPLAYHLLTNPIIDVDGDRAIGNWHLTIMLNTPDRTSVLVSGIFDDDYVRTPEGWRIKRSRFTLALTGKHEGAWSVSAQTNEA
jgi:hypothetical protein